MTRLLELSMGRMRAAHKYGMFGKCPLPALATSAALMPLAGSTFVNLHPQYIACPCGHARGIGEI